MTTNTNTAEAVQDVATALRSYDDELANKWLCEPRSREMFAAAFARRFDSSKPFPKTARLVSAVARLDRMESEEREYQETLAYRKSPEFQAQVLAEMGLA